MVSDVVGDSMRIGISLPVRELGEDLGAVREFAQTAENVGFKHLRVPDQVLRPNAGFIREPLVMLSYIAGLTKRIELVPSVIVAPARQTVLLGRQVADLDLLTAGRVRLGLGVGGSEVEYRAMGQDFRTRGERLAEQINLLRRLWREDQVDFSGRWDQVEGGGLNPRPERDIPIWVGARGTPIPRIRQRIALLADGWFVTCKPSEFLEVRESIDNEARRAGRDPSDLGTEASISVVGDQSARWPDALDAWRNLGLTHLCLRTFGARLNADRHLTMVRELAAEVL
ncbi:MAG: TIGR03619 family F420-dependent LLM class oxidoreductase [Acidimicrobiia bacterium]